VAGPIAGVKIADNLAALVAVLDRSFVPEIEAASGPSRRVSSDVNMGLKAADFDAVQGYSSAMTSR
jgi:hypothetical protein